MKITQPKDFFIAEPYTVILGGQDIFLEEGFTMNLTCLVKDSPEPPQYIFWYHNQQVNHKRIKLPFQDFSSAAYIIFIRKRCHKSNNQKR